MRITPNMIVRGAKAIHRTRGKHARFEHLTAYLQQKYRDEAEACLAAALIEEPPFVPADVQVVG